jgi:hypothetical protein
MAVLLRVGQHNFVSDTFGIKSTGKREAFNTPSGLYAGGTPVSQSTSPPARRVAAHIPVDRRSAFPQLISFCPDCWFYCWFYPKYT